MPTVSLMIEIRNGSLAGEERDEQATDLGRKLREIEGATLSTIASAATSNGSSDGSLIGGYSLNVGPSREELGGALEVIRDWTVEVPTRTVVVELEGDRIEVNGAGRAHATLREFLDKHVRAVN